MRKLLANSALLGIIVFFSPLILLVAVGIGAMKLATWVYENLE